MKYKVGEDESFGVRAAGEIVKGKIIIGDENLALMYFPPSRKHGECGSVGIGHKVGEYWEKLGDDRVYLNLDDYGEQDSEIIGIIEELKILKNQ